MREAAGARVSYSLVQSVFSSPGAEVPVLQVCEQVISTLQGTAEGNDHSADYFPALTGTVREGNTTAKRLNTAPMFNV